MTTTEDQEVQAREQSFVPHLFYNMQSIQDLLEDCSSNCGCCVRTKVCLVQFLGLDQQYLTLEGGPYIQTVVIQ